MGYSAATPIKNAKLHEEMLAFAKANFRPWHLITPEKGLDPDHDWTAYPTDDLSYDSGKHRIGFNFSNSGSLVGEYGFALLRWMAVKAGRKQAFKKFNASDEPVPYTVYDGRESWPVLVVSQWEMRVTKNGLWCLTNEDGWKPLLRPWIPPTRREDGLVETAVLIEDISNQDVLRPILVKIGVTESQVTEMCSQEPPHRIHSTEPTNLLYLEEELRKASIKHSFEYGPLVLGILRKQWADTEGPDYDKSELIIKDELRRLSELWDGYHDT